MKKVRIMLTAIAVLAVVGGAFAFKAQKFSSKKLYYITADGSCVSKTSITTNGSVEVPLPSGALSGFYTTRVNNECQGDIVTAFETAD